MSLFDKFNPADNIDFTDYEKLKRAKVEIERLHKFVSMSCKNNTTQYMVGQYNALEFAVSILNGRDPQFYEEDEDVANIDDIDI